jgi:LacI family transcriptional regulator
MTHRFPIKEIARQAGLGTATVDRALNGRAHVSPQTRARVATAIAELTAQEAQLAARGRRLFVDILVEAPARFTREIAAAASAALPQVTGAVIRPRFLFREVMTGAEVVAALDRIRRRGSQGICLKARDLPAVRAAVDRLAAAGIPVFTLVTDLPGSARAGYVGLDNAGAGRTAAHLVAHGLTGPGGTVLAVLSQDAFAGEAERLAGFRATLADLRPGITIRDVAGGAGLPADTARRVAAELAAHGPVDAVYSIGGGNAAILAALEAHGLGSVPFIAHDLDRENRALLEAGRIRFVLHHDLVADMRRLYLAVMAAHRLAADPMPAFSSDVHVVGPYNLPTLPR